MSMDPTTRAALEGSIKKWRRIVDGTGEDLGANNCPLCVIFLTATLRCDGCPVAERSGMRACRGTPYTKWNVARGEERSATTPELKAAAQAELDFLISLRPAEAKP